MTTRSTPVWLLVSLAVGIGCSSSTSEPPPDAPSTLTLTLTPVAWNPSKLDLGTVQAVAEQDKSVLVFGTKGVDVLTSGSLVRSDESVTAWKSAAVVPSSNGLSTWTVGIDESGHVLRISDEGTPEDVSDRYGLAADRVLGVIAGAGRVAFLLESGVAVSDGTNVTRFKVPARAVAASGSAVALADSTAIRIFDQGKELDVPLADVQLVAYDGAGTLMAATSHALYRVADGSASLVHDAGSRTIHQLASAGANVWLSLDGDLLLWQGGRVAVAAGGTLAPDARLVGSASGDVWVISAGELLRWGAQAAAGGDEGTWNTTVQPVYASVCSNCHSPPGSGKSSSNIDLSTYAAWDARRSSVYLRVVTQAGSASQMPPPSSGFPVTDTQRSAIQSWAKP